MKNQHKHWFYWLSALIIIGALFRISHLDWDQGYFLHPDERLYINASNISWPKSLESLLSPNSPLNPHMFYYGTFPLYMYKFMDWIVTTIHAYGTASSLLLTSRFTSALFNIFSLILLARLAYVFFDRKTALLAVGLLAFFPGAIQVAHFNTTESFLLFFSSAILFSSLQLYRKFNWFWFVISAILVGCAAATKIVGISYAVIPAVALIPALWSTWRGYKYKSFFTWVGVGVLLGLVIVLTYVAISPYSLIAREEFWQQQSYMQAVIKGDTKPPFVIIYEGTTKYLYYLTSILPWQTSFVIAPFLLFSWGYVAYLAWKRRSYFFFMILIWPTAYFAVSGAWYAKFSRYLIPLLPYFALLGSITLLEFIKQYKETSQRSIIVGVLFIQFLFAVAFMRIYQGEHTRIRASEWIYQHVPRSSLILGEHWDDPLPLMLKDFHESRSVEQMEVYNPESQAKWEKIGTQLENADYIVLSSRRVYYSILRNPELYPVTVQFYQQLFAGNLGYQLVASFTQYPGIAKHQLNTDSADESFQSYDHPPVLIFQKNQKISTSETLRRIFSN
ncbi:phospholipid carrier-dependent glycosyltransferase [candidate division WWE3 bacterium]|nr:phospholipid carrier-dependent glycosyltransferase [candidate division WWE3 bacterium]